MSGISASNLAAQVQSISPNMLDVLGQSKQTGESSFKDMLFDSIQQVNKMQQDADHAMESWATGGDVNPSEVLIAVQKADMAFRTMLQLRNKLVSAYQEIKDIRV